MSGFSRLLLVFCLAAAVGCAPPPSAPLTAIPPCAAGAEADLLAAEALQCWFTAPHGRWRILSHESHFDALVVDVEVTHLRDADDIARRVVANARPFSEVLIYAHGAGEGAATIRRVRWTRTTGFEALEFAGQARR